MINTEHIDVYHRDDQLWKQLSPKVMNEEWSKLSYPLKRRITPRLIIYGI